MLELGGAGLAVFLAGIACGGLIVFVLHDNHWLGNQEPRKPAAFSEAPEPRGGELAERFRPRLKFDSREEWRPLNISRLFEERKEGVAAHRFCRRPPAEPGCVRIQNVADFRQQADKASALGSATYIDLAGSTLGDYRGPVECGRLADCDTGPTSAIYYHVMQSNDRFYIDYWWFLRFNHFYRSSPKVTCRSAFARANGICDEHEGDWEGVTVVTPPNDDQHLDYVVYAAHKGTFRYAAAKLGGQQERRPYVYVARGSHASYPRPCPRSCDQPTALAAKGLVTLPESSFDGARDWARNGEDCRANAPGSCLLALPRTDRDPQAWTVWPGQWGAGCGDVCVGKPGPDSPRSPGLQARYQTPWCSTQGALFTCDGVALGCHDWLGPLVAAVACDPNALGQGLRSPKAKRRGTLALTVKGESKTTETTPGVVQALGDPLAPGDTVTVAGGGPGVQILVRAQQQQYLVEARFDNLGRQQNAVISVGKGVGGPTVLLAGRKPVERRILEVQPSPGHAGKR